MDQKGKWQRLPGSFQQSKASGLPVCHPDDSTIELIAGTTPPHYLIILSSKESQTMDEYTKKA